jgi:hypothetical protein
VLDILLESGTMSRRDVIEETCSVLGVDDERVAAIVDGLLAEGLLRAEGELVRIA